MRRKPGQPQEESLPGGPYRRANGGEKPIDFSKEGGNFSIDLLRDLKEGGLLPEFKMAIEMHIKPEDIIIRTSDNQFFQHEKTQKIGDEGVTYYHYINKDNPLIKMVISLNPNLDQACIISLSTEESIEKLKKEQDQKQEIQKLIAAEKNKVGLELEDDLKPSHDFEALNDFFEVGTTGKIKDFDPSDIIFYSNKFGILKLKKIVLESGDTNFYWSDKEDKFILEVAHVSDVLEKRPFYLRSITENGVKKEL